MNNLTNVDILHSISFKSIMDIDAEINSARNLGINHLIPLLVEEKKTMTLIHKAQIKLLKGAANVQ